ncbi:hypothetical protein QR680_018214 [Steinernema hermaphroditum]|uniref:Uncharacterized protein n=1 Tax=Steinernema hermaphroditum TaxID=289476 RepID=A0AA39HH84_9BILA|nr:hypothetical protein QR680_018214 [Steinernema hermaphroditum]
MEKDKCLKRHEVEQLLDMFERIRENSDHADLSFSKELDALTEFLKKRYEELKNDTIIDDDTVKNYMKHVAQEVASRSYSTLPATTHLESNAVSDVDSDFDLDEQLAALRLSCSSLNDNHSLRAAVSSTYSPEAVEPKDEPAAPSDPLPVKQKSVPPIWIKVDVINKAMGFNFDEDKTGLDQIRYFPTLVVPKGTQRAEGPLRDLSKSTCMDLNYFLAGIVMELAEDPEGHIEPELGPAGVAFADYCCG